MHWTYANNDTDGDLEQGDILQPTDVLKEILSAVHPHFDNDKYLGFMVATQSCDLVVRKSKPKASYISISPIRPLSHVLQKVLRDFAIPSMTDVLPISRKVEAPRFLERLFNQNEQASGFFYLHEDADAGIAEAAVGLLRITVSLRSDHYDALLRARVGSLTSEFRAKLGWLIGNLYARPATRDWSDGREDKILEALIVQFLSEGRWIDDEIIASAETEKVDIGLETAEILEKLRYPTRQERALGEVLKELERVVPDDPKNTIINKDEIIKKLENRLRNNGKFLKLFR